MSSWICGFKQSQWEPLNRRKLEAPWLIRISQLVSVFQMHRLFFKVVHMVLEKSKYDLIKLNTQKLFDIGARTLENNHTTLLVSYPAFQTNLVVVLPTIQYIQLVTWMYSFPFIFLWFYTRTYATAQNYEIIHADTRYCTL